MDNVPIIKDHDYNNFVYGLNTFKLSVVDLTDTVEKYRASWGSNQGHSTRHRLDSDALAD